ncbi:DUF3306 domain-containing protein [Photobacterium rosenbergii]|uniref:DUF3306 domain-containing protein n=1 Tax=Photobacterium rosenbergii TaxID=294936 RepID=A0ABU3ZF65_9GAMM|nr:DUF3306 domain-containing protein [Photobacterium rosenbergii]MDV5168757.1 DUF3306 domain-containing protein [Photobacterium rosenbergii]
MATNFFQRWSQRKIKAKDEGEPHLEPDTKEQELIGHEPVVQKLVKDDLDPSESESTASNETVKLDDEDNGSDPQTTLPELTLADAAKVTFDSGVSTFMKQGVEKSVKKAALRKLFHSEEFNYISDMDDHTEDFSNVPVLDTKVTQQLRQWVNEVAETAEEALNACTEAGSEAHTVKNTPEQLETATPGSYAQGTDIQGFGTQGSDAQDPDSNDAVDVETGLALSIPTEIESEEKSS